MTPPNDPKPDQADSLKQARLATIQLAGAFHAVFGDPGKRTDAQKLVIEHFRDFTGTDSNSFDFSRAGDGISAIARGIHRDGAQTVFRSIERQISIYHRSKSGEDKPLPKIKR